MRVDSVVNNNLICRDLYIKRFSFALIAIINCAAIIGIYAYIVMYVNLPSKPLLIASFVIGVIGAFVALRGEGNRISAPSNTTALVGKIVTWLFFGPTEYLYNYIDWTDYRDPMVVNEIAEDFSHCPFSTLSEKYTKSIKNLMRYQIIKQETCDKFLNLNEEYKKLKVRNDLFEKHGESFKNKKLERSSFSVFRAQVQKDLEDLEKSWIEHRDTIKAALPRPSVKERLENI